MAVQGRSANPFGRCGGGEPTRRRTQKGNLTLDKQFCVLEETSNEESGQEDCAQRAVMPVGQGSPMSEFGEWCRVTRATMWAMSRLESVQKMSYSSNRLAPTRRRSEGAHFR